MVLLNPLMTELFYYKASNKMSLKKDDGSNGLSYLMWVGHRAGVEPCQPPDNSTLMRTKLCNRLFNVLVHDIQFGMLNIRRLEYIVGCSRY